ncbi:MAG: response regulator transcription factor [Prevotellaceae bacterium]|jgi:two-component system response regulator NreC|nr:response regulator transcription factor [Prevotellaceae bacterium]
MINTIICDDHLLFRLGIKAIIEAKYADIKIVGEADCGAALFDLLKKTAADILLLDVKLPDMSGIEIAKKLKIDFPNLKILTISSENSAETVKQLIDIGVNGFISKRQGSTDDLGAAIRAIVSGEEYFGRDISSVIYDIFVAKRAICAEKKIEFTDKEREIIAHCQKGLQCKEIADRMNISQNTVNTHKKNIFEKLGINNTMEMVQYALKNKIIEIN